MKVIHVSCAFPPALGGMEKVVQILAGLQATAGMRVSVITSNRGAKLKGLPAAPYKVFRLKSFIFLSTTFMPSLFFRLLAVPRSTVVHLHITQAFTPEMVWLASRIKRFPYVAHLHIDAPRSTWAGVLLLPYKKLLLRCVLRSALYVIVFTEDQKQVVRARYGLREGQVKVIPNGVEDHFYTTRPRIMHRKPRLLFVGRLSLQKNVPLLLRALQGISNQFETRLVGDGELEGELRSLAGQLRLQNVVFAGRKNGKELLDEYRQADIFVLPSEREGMPLVLLEAMAMGLPIVATNVVGSRDVVVNGENGFLVKLDDADAYRKALLDVKNDPTLYKKFSGRSLELARWYSWKRVTDKVQELYDGAKI